MLLHVLVLSGFLDLFPACVCVCPGTLLVQKQSFMNLMIYFGCKYGLFWREGARRDLPVGSSHLLVLPTRNAEYD
jgi:hypothetical protein